MNAITRLYLDHAATTPIIEPARHAISQEAAIWANPSSPHNEGRASKARLEKYRKAVKAALGWDGHILFTSGASEAIAMVMRSYPHDILVSGGEHEAVLASSGVHDGNAKVIPLGSDGYADEAALIEILSDAHRPLCAIQSVNNETGIMQPWDQLIDIIHEKGGVAFADCSQSAGKMALPHADIIALSGHKLGGPPGIGALLIKDLGLLNPTGGQEQGYRRGTENGPYVAAMAAALNNGYDWMAKAASLRQSLDDAIITQGGIIIGEHSNRLPTIASYRMPGVGASAQLIEFDMKGISVSAGSACSSGTLKTSHVLQSMGYDNESASEVIRVSFGPDTNDDDVARFLGVWEALHTRHKNAR